MVAELFLLNCFYRIVYLYQNIRGNGPAVTVIDNVDSSQKIHQKVHQCQFKCSAGGQYNLTESETEATFENSAKDDARIRSTPVKLIHVKPAANLRLLQYQIWTLCNNRFCHYTLCFYKNNFLRTSRLKPFQK